MIITCHLNVQFRRFIFLGKSYYIATAFFLDVIIFLKGKDQEQLNKVIIPRREKSLVVDKDFAIDFKKLELEKRDLRRSMLYEVTMLASLQISEATSEEEQALPGAELQAL